jgi:hypothetical protein
MKISNGTVSRSPDGSVEITKGCGMDGWSSIPGRYKQLFSSLLCSVHTGLLSLLTSGHRRFLLRV